MVTKEEDNKIECHLLTHLFLYHHVSHLFMDHHSFGSSIWMLHCSAPKNSKTPGVGRMFFFDVLEVHHSSLQVGGSLSRVSHQNTPLKINMEHNHGGLEDHFPF